MRPLSLKAAQKQMELMEMETKRFYEAAALGTTDAGIRQLLGDWRKRSAATWMRPDTSPTLV